MSLNLTAEALPGEKHGAYNSCEQVMNRRPSREGRGPKFGSVNKSNNFYSTNTHPLETKSLTFPNAFKPEHKRTCYSQVLTVTEYSPYISMPYYALALASARSS